MKVDRGTADETKQFWRGRRGRRTLALIFAALEEQLLARFNQSRNANHAEVDC
jgi:hypothetical protein